MRERRWRRSRERENSKPFSMLGRRSPKKILRRKGIGRDKRSNSRTLKVVRSLLTTKHLMENQETLTPTSQRALIGRIKISKRVSLGKTRMRALENLYRRITRIPIKDPTTPREIPLLRRRMMRPEPTASEIQNMIFH